MYVKFAKEQVSIVMLLIKIDESHVYICQGNGTKLMHIF